MTELIKVTTNEQGSKVVSARDLHEFLEVTSRFNDWFNNMLKYGFEENVDYISFTKNLVSGGRSIEYAISIDMAKELSMIQRTDKGKQARKYFIECEKKLKQPKELSRIELLTIALEAEKKVIIS